MSTKPVLLDSINLEYPAGIENQFVRYIRAEDQGDSPSPRHFVVLSRGLSEAYEDLSDRAEVYHYKRSGFPFKVPRLLRSWLLRRRLRGTPVSGVVFHSGLGRRGRRDVLLDLEVPKLYYEHGNVWFRSEIPPEFAAFDAFLTPSEAGRVMLREKGGVEERRIEVIPNMVPGEDYLASRVERDRFEARIREAHDLPPDVFLVVFVGRLEPYKGVESLLRAAGILRDRPVRFLVVGDGDSMEALRGLKSERGLDNVHFEGFQRNPAPYYRLSDLVVIPSVREPFGLVALEAAVHERPLLVSAVDGLVDTVRDPSLGYRLEPAVSPSEIDCPNPHELPEHVVDKDGNLVPPKFLDPEELAETIETVRAEYDRAREKAKKLRRAVLRRNSPERYVERLHDVYRNVGVLGDE